MSSSFFKYFSIILLLCSVILIVPIAKNLNLIAQDGSKTTIKYNSKKDKLTYPLIKNIENKLTLAGKIDAEIKSELRFQTSGRLVWIGVKVGDRVKKGQAIASLDKTELKKQLAKDFNDYRTTLSEFDDTDYTYKDKKMRYLITEDLQRIIDRTQFTLNNAVIDYELQDLAIKYATLTSPINGIVVAMDQQVPNVNITAATATFTIIDPQSIYVKSEVDESDIPKVKLNQPVSLRLDSFPDNNVQSYVSYVSFSPISGQSSTVYEIRFPLNAQNSDLGYRLGMNGDVNIILDSIKDALTIPIEYITDENDKKYVYIKKNNDIIKKQIKTGIENDTDVQVLEGLSKNDQILQKIK